MLVVFLVFCSLLGVSCAADDTHQPDHMSIDMAARRGAISPPPEHDLSEIRHHEVTRFTDNLLKEYRYWYKVANVSEMLGALCTVGCPVLSGISASTRDVTLSTWSMGVGLAGVAFVNFSNYAIRESTQRGMAANQMLRQEGLPIVPLLRNSSDDMSAFARRTNR